MRRVTVPVKIGPWTIGSEFPVRVQSMTNCSPNDIEGNVNQIRHLYEAGCEVVRLTIPNEESILSLKKIIEIIRQNQIPIPIVADVHFSPTLAIKVLPLVDKVRINPGNFTKIEDFKTLIHLAKQEGKSLRIGVNHGSLSKKILHQFGNTAEGMIHSVLEFIAVAEKESFDQIVLSFKSSDVAMMVEVNQKAADFLDSRGLNFPFHLGVTEAGNDTYGRTKGAIGIGSLLLRGIGDTIRVSLTEDPLQEIPAAYQILQACKLRQTSPEYIACPSCGRTQFDIQKIFNEIKEKTRHFKNIKIAVMGCVVNGIGEMADADYGYVGAGKNKVNLYHKGKLVVAQIPESSAVETLLNLISKTAVDS